MQSLKLLALNMFLLFLLISTLTPIALGLDHEMRIVNSCSHLINIGISADNFTQQHFPLNSKESKTINLPHGWTSGRIWGTVADETGTIKIYL